MKKTVIIGLGAISEVHIASICENTFAKIVAVCDVLPERIEQAKTRIPYAVNGYTDYKEMLEKEKPEVAHICTPHFLHAPMAMDAMRSGADVYLEKPAALDYQEALSILDVQNQTGRKVCVSFQNRVIPTSVMAKQMADDEALGKFLGARGFMTWRRDGAYYTESNWRGKWATEGGGVLMNQSIHTLDLLQHFGGKVAKTEGTASLRKNRGIIEVEDTAEATLTYENGKTALFYATNCNVKDSSVQIDLYFENGSLMLYNNRLYKDQGNGFELLLDDSENLAVGKLVWGNGHAMMMKRFYAALDGENTEYCTLEDGIQVLKIIQNVYGMQNNFGEI